MKTKNNFLVSTVIFLLCIGCNPDNDILPEGTQKESEFGTLRGIIENYIPGLIDKIEVNKVYSDSLTGDEDEHLLGSAKVNTSGEFSLYLIDLPSHLIIDADYWLSNFTLKRDCVFYSMDFYEILVYKGTMNVGRIVKTNFNKWTDIDSFFRSFGKDGTVVFMLYSRTQFTMRGVHQDDYKFNFDVEIKKGWNEIAITKQQDKVGYYYSSYTYTYTTTIPNDVKWRYFGY